MTLEVHDRQVPDYWRLYDDADALVLPRRYGGLSLPALEGMGAGLALMMPDVEPQRSEWVGMFVPAAVERRRMTSAGPMDVATVDPVDLAERMDAAELPKWRAASRAWAVEHSWEELKPTIITELERVCG